MNHSAIKQAIFPCSSSLVLCLVSLLSMSVGVHDIMKGHFLNQNTHYSLFVISIVTGILAVELLMRWAETEGRIGRPSDANKE